MSSQRYDVLLVGAGVMSATLVSMLRVLEPGWKIALVERLDHVAGESSDAFSNAGTGHSALCELNYTPEKNGEIDIAKALAVNGQFQISRQYWTSLVKSGVISDPAGFINPVPHMSFVRGEQQINFLHKRWEALKDHPFFQGMEFSDSREQFKQWLPLMDVGRDPAQKLAVTRAAAGSDVDFGALTRILFASAEGMIDKYFSTEVSKLSRRDTGWVASIRDMATGQEDVLSADRVFVGAGGGALHLLQSARIPEIKGFGGFPISGQFLHCTNPEVVSQHNAKVYGLAAVGAPPMSVPHLDTRHIGGETSLLFGPYAGFSPKFLKSGSMFDLPASIRPGNIGTMLGVGAKNLDLVKYLVSEVSASRDKRMAALREFYPQAKDEDWSLIVAGQRVQVMKKVRGKASLQFGTELVASHDGSIAGLLGASPGASTAVPIMLNVLKTCYSDRYPKWRTKLKKMVPTIGRNLATESRLAKSTMKRTATALGLHI